MTETIKEFTHICSKHSCSAGHTITVRATFYVARDLGQCSLSFWIEGRHKGRFFGYAGETLKEALQLVTYQLLGQYQRAAKQLQETRPLSYQVGPVVPACLVDLEREVTEQNWQQVSAEMDRRECIAVCWAECQEALLAQWSES